jgi:hypothetical protein
MTRRFVIGIDKLDDRQNKEFTDYLRDFGGWWHWIDNLWLLAVEGNQSITAQSIQQKVSSINQDARVIVLEVGADIDWYGKGALNASGKNQHDWFKKTWLGKDQ